MVLDLAISLISSLPSPLLHGLATIFLFPIFPSIGLQIHPRLEMGRTGVPPSVVTRPPRGGEKYYFALVLGEEERGKRPSQDVSLSLGLTIELGKKKRGGINLFG
ncbi:hypothetical protein Acr_08g0016810 [Actinidia rufa]|uniref:Uncharacterized protein n=1 Tax=Actinidia rufa TaxID=165716 RepID=A0A7J0F3L2_9ERIC|nr:hypothetical protein Acr_08g0016810 [Actinidia rufa]